MAQVEVEKTVKFTTTRFGLVEVDRDNVVHFVDEVPGFPEAKRFVLIPHAENSPFSWLQSVELPEVAFVVTDPWLFFADYKPVVDEGDLDLLDVKDGTEDSVSIFVMLTIPGDPHKMTANLQAPVVINLKNNRAKQVILASDRYTTRHALLRES